MTERQQREAREKIARDLSEFKRSGGKIQRIPRGVSGTHYTARLGISIALSGSSNRIEQHHRRQFSGSQGGT